MVVEMKSETRNMKCDMLLTSVVPFLGRQGA
jgi:hypothetical protein